ncbi:MAG: hypothetical protein M1826_001530 [Phylliscum demangeonii]|nr:MAG: hypothetical protein M1826_001530 [Phylliscum demangeonii]
MKAAALVVNFHNENAPIYSAHFEPHGKGRLATAGGDNNVRLWKVQCHGEERHVTYLTTLVKHTQAVNVVRFCPRGEMLASAGDDGNVLLWVPSEIHTAQTFGEDGAEDKESWRIKHMCRSSGAEIYDLAWSPDGVFFITGSMDNVARIYNAQTGQMVRQIAEHNHYVQGVAWDPLNEFVATQSSDRSVHIYALKNKDGQFSLAQHGKFSRMDLPSRRISSHSPAPPDVGPRAQLVAVTDASTLAVASPIPSAPGTPTSLPLPMNPPAMTSSRRSSFSSSPSMRRSISPAPSLPLPAVKPMEASPKIRNANIYANETLTSFFRRLTFAPDGSLLFTPAGLYKVSQPSAAEGAKTADEALNTVYIYTRAGFHKPPIAHLPGHKKASIAVRCSPIFYAHRKSPQSTRHITLDTASGEDAIASLPEPVLPTAAPSTGSLMEPPAMQASATTSVTPNESTPAPPSSHKLDVDPGPTASGPMPAFALPYRIVYAVATQDAILVYDTQQRTPLCIVSNLHFATFTDVTWSMDGLTLLMSSSDGFCSTLSFTPGELGQIYSGSTTLSLPPSASSSALSTPAAHAGLSTPHPPTAVRAPSHAPPRLRSFSPSAALHPASPSRSNSASSVATQSSLALHHSRRTSAGLASSAAQHGHVPSLGAGASQSPATGAPLAAPLPLSTPPQTPLSSSVAGTNAASTPSISISQDGNVLGKRESAITSESEQEDEVGVAHRLESVAKKRKITPTVVTSYTSQSPAPPESSL